MRKEILIGLILMALLPLAAADCHKFQHTDINGTGDYLYVDDANGITYLCNYEDLNKALTDYNTISWDYNKMMNDTNQVQGQLSACNKNNLDLTTKNTELLGTIETKSTELSGKEAEIATAKSETETCETQKQTIAEDYNNNVSQLKTLCAGAKTATEGLLQETIMGKIEDQNKNAAIITALTTTSSQITEIEMLIGIVIIIAALYALRNKLKIKMPTRKKQEPQYPIQPTKQEPTIPAAIPREPTQYELMKQILEAIKKQKTKTHHPKPIAIQPETKKEGGEKNE